MNNIIIALLTVLLAIRSIAVDIVASVILILCYLLGAINLGVMITGMAVISAIDSSINRD